MFHGTPYIVRPLWLQCAYEGLWERELRVNAVGKAAVWGREGVHCGAALSCACTCWDVGKEMWVCGCAGLCILERWFVYEGCHCHCVSTLLCVCVHNKVKGKEQV